MDTHDDTIHLEALFPMDHAQCLSRADYYDGLAAWLTEQWEKNMHPQARGDERRALIAECLNNATTLRKHVARNHPNKRKEA